MSRMAGDQMSDSRVEALSGPFVTRYHEHLLQSTVSSGGRGQQQLVTPSRECHRVETLRAYTARAKSSSLKKFANFFKNYREKYDIKFCTIITSSVIRKSEKFYYI